MVASIPYPYSSPVSSHVETHTQRVSTPTKCFRAHTRNE
jgi:hypothetical protein